MDNKLAKKKYNKLLSGRNHYFKFGDFLFKADDEGNVTNRSLNNLSELGSGLLNFGSSAVGQIGGGLIGGGLQSTAGNVLSGLGNIASVIPGPWGDVASAGFGGLSGIANRLFGSKLNKENIAKVQSNINALNAFQSNASDYDTLASNWSSAPTGMTFSNSFIGSDGIFSNKAERIANRLRDQVSAGDLWVSNNLANNAANIDKNQLGNLLSRSAAYGGPIFAEGGTIHINPENKGKFTETKRRTGKTTEELTHSKNPLTRKRAIFSQNAKKWKHEDGGNLMTHGANFSTGLTFINNGDTHENNPFEGVPMGMDSEGVPNLVEEGEVIYNDYVFSNRLKVPEKEKKGLGLSGYKGITYAKASTILSKESRERPNDPISKLGLEDSMNKLIMSQEKLRMKRGDTNNYARGGKLGRKYEGNIGDPLSQWLVNPLGLFVKTNSMDLGLPKEPKLELNTPSTWDINTSFGNISTPLYSTNPLKLDTPELNLSLDTDTNTIPRNKPNLYNTKLRYAPAYASGIMSLTDALGITNKPDYSDVNLILNAANNSGSYTPVKYSPIGQYLPEYRFDRDYYINKLNENAGATRRAILNTSGNNRAQALAGILAADYAAQSKLGDLIRQAEELSMANKQRVAEFNRGTDVQNSQGFLQAATANQSAAAQAKSSYLSGILSASNLRQQERQAAAAARSANLSNFINSLGDIGRENFAMNMVVTDPSKYYYIDNGEIKYKNDFYNLPYDQQTYIMGDAVRRHKKRSRGGYLTIKK